MKLNPDTFNDIRKAVHDLCGIVIAEDKHYLVVSRLEPILKRNGLPSYESLVQGLKQPNSLRLQEQIVEAITTKETSFNRDGHPFEELRRSILPELASRADREAGGDEAPRSEGSHLVHGRGDGPGSLQRGDGRGGLPGEPAGPRPDPRRLPDPGDRHLPGALAIAREGRYSTPEVSRGISPEQRARYFRHVHGALGRRRRRSAA